MRIYGTIFFVTAVLIAAVFWHYCGRSLQYEVHSDSTHWYSEDFPLVFRIGFTVGVALIAAALPTWLVYAYRHGYHHKSESNVTRA